MTEELLEKLIDAQLKLTEKFCEVLDLMKLETQSRILESSYRASQTIQNQGIISALEYQGGK